MKTRTTSSISQLSQLDVRRITSSPAALAYWETNGQWYPHRHLQFLNRLLTDLAAGRLTSTDGVTVTNKLLLSMPPQHGKSELTSKWFPVWYLGKRPHHRIIHNSYGDKYSQSWGRRARGKMKACGELFGVRLSDEKKEQREWEIAEYSGSMFSAGVKGECTGRPAELLLIDDPHKNAEEAVSELEQEKTWDMFQTGPLTRLADGGAVAGIATRWHSRDLFGRLMERWDSEGVPYRYVNLPALAEYGDPMGRCEGEPLCPELKSLKFLEGQRKTLNRYWWSALYQGNPTQYEGAEFPDEYFEGDVWFDDWPTHPLVRVLVLDPSKGKDAKKSDYSAYVSLSVDRDDTLYVDADLQRRPVPAMVNDGVSHYLRFGPHAFGVEANAWQDLLVGEFGRAFERAGMIDPDPWAINNNTPKPVRIRRLGPLLSQRRVRFKRNSPGVQLLISQLREFPNAMHDDGPDALEMAYRLAQQMLAGVDAPDDPEGVPA